MFLTGASMRKSETNADTIDFKKAKLVSTFNNISRQYSDNNDIISKLTRRLQTTLDTRKIVELFSEELAQVIEFQQFSYQDAENITFKSSDKAGVHSCQFNLRLDHEALGTIKLSRKKRFLEEEMAIVERLASTLVFPLNNAKMYYAALQSALIDELTGLGNKRALQSDLRREAERSVRKNTPLSIIILDLDHFKNINDTHGHLAGDQVLKNLAKTLNSSARQSDLSFRYGGEEFLVILDATNPRQAKQIAERLRSSISQQNFYYGAKPIPVTASLGCATLNKGESLEDFIGRADKALYIAKNSGRNQSVSFEEIEALQDETNNITKSA
jgi:diguanylate cyclase (GGDEF)-like protein